MLKELLVEIEALENKRYKLASECRPWTATVHDQIVQGQKTDVFELLEELGSELEIEIEVQKDFLTRPVELPTGFEDEQELITAVFNLANGQSAFGLIGIVGKSKQKQILKQVRVLEKIDLKESDDWSHVLHFLEHRRRLRQLAFRWNALISENGLDALPGTNPEHGLAAIQQYRLYELIIAVVAAEKSVATRAAKLFPSYEPVRCVLFDNNATELIANAIHHHLLKNRLSNVWSIKEQFQYVKCTPLSIQCST